MKKGGVDKVKSQKNDQQGELNVVEESSLCDIMNLVSEYGEALKTDGENEYSEVLYERIEEAANDLYCKALRLQRGAAQEVKRPNKPKKKIVIEDNER